MFEFIKSEVDRGFLESLKQRSAAAVMLDIDRCNPLSRETLTQPATKPISNPHFRFDMTAKGEASVIVLVKIHKDLVDSFRLIQYNDEVPWGLATTIPIRPSSYIKAPFHAVGEVKPVHATDSLVMGLKKIIFADFLEHFDSSKREPNLFSSFFTYWKERTWAITVFHNNVGAFYRHSEAPIFHGVMNATVYQSPECPFTVNFTQATNPTQIEISIQLAIPEALRASVDSDIRTIGKRMSFIFQQPKNRYLNGTLEFADMTYTGIQQAARTLLIGSKVGSELLKAGMVASDVGDIVAWAAQGLETAMQQRRYEVYRFKDKLSITYQLKTQ